MAGTSGATITSPLEKFHTKHSKAMCCLHTCPTWGHVMTWPSKGTNCQLFNSRLVSTLSVVTEKHIAWTNTSYWMEVTEAKVSIQVDIVVRDPYPNWLQATTSSADVHVHIPVACKSQWQMWMQHIPVVPTTTNRGMGQGLHSHFQMVSGLSSFHPRTSTANTLCYSNTHDKLPMQ